jgi:hypothetical protein
MLKVLIYNKGNNEDKSGDKLRTAFGTNEDSLTASVFQLLSYLPDEVLWRVIRQTLKNENLPETVGKLETIEFWAKWNAEGTTNINFVEPDVFLAFGNLNIIVEAKRYDAKQQSYWQWKNELIAYENEYSDNEKTVILWALGGIHQLKTEEVSTKKETYKVVKSTWTMLLSTIKSELQKDDNQARHSQQLLNDLIEAFAFHGFFVGTWLSEAGFEKQNIQNSSMNYFINNKEKYDSQKWLFSLPKINIQSQNLKAIQSWKTH